MLTSEFLKLYEELSILNESKADIEKLIAFAGQELADRFLSIRNKLSNPENDLYYWINHKTAADLEQYVSDVEMSSSNTKNRKAVKEQGAKLVCETAHWLVYHILSQAAAQIYGRNTKWCISSVTDGDEHWRSYTDFNDIFFLISKESPDVNQAQHSKFALVIDPERGYYEAYDQQDNKLETLYDIPFIEEVEIPDYIPLEEIEPWPDD